MNNELYLPIHETRVGESRLRHASLKEVPKNSIQLSHIFATG